jgi:hypothetical protein
MDKFLPNVAILKSPSNWFLVAFSLAILLTLSHVFFNKRTDS